MSDESENNQGSSKLDSEQLGAYNIMRNVDGRHFIWRQLQKCGVFESMFNIDPIMHAHNAGLREAGLKLDRLVKEISPEDYLTMISENI